LKNLMENRKLGEWIVYALIGNCVSFKVGSWEMREGWIGQTKLIFIKFASSKANSDRNLYSRMQTLFSQFLLFTHSHP
jgi:hypothetical protein